MESQYDREAFLRERAEVEAAIVEGSRSPIDGADLKRAVEARLGRWTHPEMLRAAEEHLRDERRLHVTVVWEHFGQTHTLHAPAEPFDGPDYVLDDRREETFLKYLGIDPDGD